MIYDDDSNDDCDDGDDLDDDSNDDCDDYDADCDDEDDDIDDDDNISARWEDNVTMFFF